MTPSGATEANEKRDRAGDASNADPVVSVVVTAYRRRTFLREAVESVIAQTAPPESFEVIVVKDFADAELDRWLGSFGPRVRVVTEALERVGAMLERGVRLARGEIVCFLDDDDRYRPDKIEAVTARFRDDPGLALLKGRLRWIAADGRPLSRSAGLGRPGRLIVADAREAPENVVRALARMDEDTVTSNLAVRRSVLLPWLDELRHLGTYQDGFIQLLAVASGGRLRAEPIDWTDYRFHASTSHSVLSNDAAQASEALARERRHTHEALGSLDVVARRAGPNSAAARWAAILRLRTEIGEFLGDPARSLRPIDWIRAAGLSALPFPSAMRSSLFVQWLECVPRFLAPSFTAQRIRAIRRRQAAAKLRSDA